MKIEIRKVTLKDDLNCVADLIYNTDEYIYPYWFKNISNYHLILSEIMKTEGTLFYYENILVATYNQEIVGILVSVDNTTNLSSDYGQWSHINKNFKYTINKYLMDIKNHVKEDYIYISNLCIRNDFRRKKVATKLMSAAINESENKNFELHVLSKNTPAKKLYLNMGFEVVQTLKGFNGPCMLKPKINTMRKVKNV